MREGGRGKKGKGVYDDGEKRGGRGGRGRGKGGGK